MSADKKSIHIRVPEESYAKLMTMAGVHHGVDGKTTEHAELLLEKAIAGEWHIFNLYLKRYARTGFTGNEGD